MIPGWPSLQHRQQMRFIQNEDRIEGKCKHFHVSTHAQNHPCLSFN